MTQPLQIARWGTVTLALLCSFGLGCLKPDFSKECGPDEPECFKGETCYEGTCRPTDQVPIEAADAEETDPDGATDTHSPGDASDTRAPEDARDGAGADSTGDVDADVAPDADTDCRFRQLSEGVCRAYDLGPTVPCEQPRGYVEEETNQHCDGFDNDCDGRVDERCTCGEQGEQKRCYPGPVWAQETGACIESSATQSCTEEDLWSACEGSVTFPKPEVCSNRIDDDCDGALPAEDPDCE